MSDRRRLVALAAGLAVAFTAAQAFAHKEREIASPARPGPVPDLNRKSAHTIVVCKASSKPTREDHRAINARLRNPADAADLAQAKLDDAAWHRNKRLYRKCEYEHIQEAVNAALDDTTILIMPGLYREEPSRAAPTSSTGDNPDGSYSYAYHVAHPNDANLIFISKKDITLEGTGSKMTDVEIDGGFAKDVGIRCDRCEGFIVRNLWQRDVNEHGVYVVDSDGYVFDHVKGSMNGEYSLFSFASDNGLYTDCDAESGGDSALYIGGDPDTSALGRFSAELRFTKMHHAPLGFSGTQGSSVWMHHNEVYDNAIGISFDSENDHPNFPQRRSLIEDNLLYDNNFDVYVPSSDVPVRGPGYSFFRYPVGTAFWLVGGEDNVVRNNRVWNNQRFGFILAGNPLETPLPAQVHRNSFYGNIIGLDLQGAPAPNLTAFPPGGIYAPGGSDFFWDETGSDNCWGPEDASSPSVKTDPPNAQHPGPIPGPCPSINNGVGSALKLSILFACSLTPVAGTNPTEYVTQDIPFACPWGHTNDGPYLNADEAECGNWYVDRGEDCDPGYGYGGGGGPCQDLGQGTGTYSCTDLCMYDTSTCEATSCGKFTGRSRVTLRRLDPPPGNERGTVVIRDLDTAARTFDPLTESTSVALRDGTELLFEYTIPAGAPWMVDGKRATFVDGAAPTVASVRLTDTDSDGLYDALRLVFSQPPAVGAPSRTLSATVRVGDDCWRSEMPCKNSGSGRTSICEQPKG